MSTTFGLQFAICWNAKVVWYVVSGHAVNPFMGARARLPVSHGPETTYHTPSAMRVIIGQWFLAGAHVGRQVLVGVVTAGTVRDMDVEYRVTHGCV